VRKKSLAYWILTIIYGVMIFIFSDQPNLDPHLPFPQVDKLFHAFEFGLFSFLLFGALFNLPFSFPPNKVAWYVLCLTFLYAMSDEYHQSFVPGREADLWDVLADLSGAILVQWIILRRF
jgi:VanZ family protein